MAKAAFDTELDQSKAPDGPSYGPSPGYGSVRDTGIGDALTGVSNLFKAGFEAVDQKRNEDVANQFDTDIETAASKALGDIKFDDPSLDTMEKLKLSSEQNGGRTLTRFNVERAALAKQYAQEHPQNRSRYLQAMKDRGLSDPRVGLVEERVAKEKADQAAEQNIQDSMIKAYAERGMAIHTTPGDAASPIDRPATLRLAQQQMAAESRATAERQARGQFVQADGSISTKPSEDFLTRLPTRMQDVYNDVVTQIRPAIQSITGLLNSGKPVNVKDVQTAFSAIADKAQTYLQAQRAYAVKQGYNSAETEAYMKEVTSLVDGMAKGIIDVASMGDMNQMKSTALALEWAGRQAEVLNVETAPFIFQLGKLSPAIAQSLSAGLFANRNIEGIGFRAAKDITAIRDLFPSGPVTDGDAGVDTEGDYGRKEKQSRIDGAINIQQSYVKNGLKIETAEDAFPWIRSHAPLANAVQEKGLSEGNRTSLVNLFTNPNWIGNYATAKKLLPGDAAKAGRFAFNISYNSALTQLRQLSGSGTGEGLFTVQFSPEQNKFVAVTKTGKADEPGDITSPFISPFISDTSSNVPAHIRTRVDAINKLVPTLLATRDTFDNFKQGSDVDFLNGIVKFSEDMGLQGGASNEGAPLAQGSLGEKSSVTPLVEGNINLHNRPKVKNGEDISTVYSMSFGTDEGEVLVPLVSDDGRIMEEDEAIELYNKTGKHLGIFSTPDEANKYAEWLHRQQEQEYMPPRGIRNNNPGNLDRNATQWEGMSKEQKDSRFVSFDTPEHGIRAMSKTLQTYQKKYGLETVADIVSRWAPSVENDTISYVNTVAKAIGVSPTERIDVNDPETMNKLVKAIIKHENGEQPYTDEQINKGLELSGIIRNEEGDDTLVGGAKEDILGSDIAKEYLPVNARAFALSLMGSDETLDEKFFNDDEIEGLRFAVLEALDRQKNQKGGDKILDYQDYVLPNRMEKASLGREYNSLADVLDRSKNSMSYRLNMTLGSSKIVQDDDGNITIEDVYDFNSPGSAPPRTNANSSKNRWFEKGVPMEDIIHAVLTGDMNAYDALRNIGATMGPLAGREEGKKGIPIKIKLGNPNNWDLKDDT